MMSMMSKHRGAERRARRQWRIAGVAGRGHSGDVVAVRGLQHYKGDVLAHSQQATTLTSAVELPCRHLLSNTGAQGSVAER